MSAAALHGLAHRGQGILDVSHLSLNIPIGIQIKRSQPLCRMHGPLYRQLDSGQIEVLQLQAVIILDFLQLLYLFLQKFTLRNQLLLNGGRISLQGVSLLQMRLYLSFQNICRIILRASRKASMFCSSSARCSSVSLDSFVSF